MVEHTTVTFCHVTSRKVQKAKREKPCAIFKTREAVKLRKIFYRPQSSRHIPVLHFHFHNGELLHHFSTFSIIFTIVSVSCEYINCQKVKIRYINTLIQIWISTLIIHNEFVSSSRGTHFPFEQFHFWPWQNYIHPDFLNFTNEY